MPLIALPKNPSLPQDSIHRRFRGPPTFKSVDGVNYAISIPTSSTTNPYVASVMPVWELPDGQVEAFPSWINPNTLNSVNAATLPTTTIQSTSTSTFLVTVFVTGSQPGWPLTNAAASNTPVAPSSASPAVPASQATTQTFATSVPQESLSSLTTSAVQNVTAAPPADTTGSIQTTLERSGNPSSQPFATKPVSSTGTLSLVDTSTLGSIGPTASANITGLQVNDIFQPIATNAPPPQISSRSDHPVPRLGIVPQQQKLETNKFYGNFYLGDQSAGTWTHPYSIAWSKGAGETNSWGMAVSHTERDQLATAPATSVDAGEWAYFVNPVGIQSLVLSATELGNGTTLTTDTLEAFSVNVNLIADGDPSPTITFPLVQGMAFVTGVYNDATPLLQSGLGIQSVTYTGSVLNGTTFKYTALLANGFTWLIYVTPSSSGYQENSFTLISPVAIQGASGFSGFIQVAKLPANTSDAEAVYDGSAGAYATAVNISGSVEDTTGTFSLSWTKAGTTSQPLLIFALPHHISSFASDTSAGVTDVQLVTATKGYSTAVCGDRWTLLEPDLPITMSFAPWSPSLGSVDTLPAAAITAINQAGAVELAEDIAQQTNTGSMYYDGKALAKFAAIVYVLHELADNDTLALTGLVELQTAFELHVNNNQTYPLVYDTCRGGAVSISTYLNGNSGDDFGNTYYNDHHFHYGYFLYAAAVVGYINPSWLQEGTNKAWVDMLARDYANSITDDSYFPFSRMFDWYNGHSWAEGLFESADGKNEESSSEDTMASYGVKMWGFVAGDTNMEARGNLMLAIQARSLSDYFLYLDTNAVEPAQFTGNKVSGILFENKIDHTTYFGNEVAYIEGIHMLPLMPMSTLIRSPTFVQQEWTAYELGAVAPTLQSGWRGILMANLAIVDAGASWEFFSNATGEFGLGLLDGGASWTWYLAWSAALGGLG
ncbi:glycosyl hydrolase family 81-domain-containing protein [Neohortaea acidophila]|uniref:glucan endo-1,3-beta-D-glucosidase n=1 Tax=Neohortaea acidophila TaxID=245834 RepID=A0A6A6PGX7_9PEZI|nr:glycosyl hydrolase family 81-domain-containing protein [Neohortaea acidophila]KAF2479242.1 glycosyl hydrolase family 81-domain-containing protein [Neohortaea acidophila]